MFDRHCVANHWRVEGQRGIIRCHAGRKDVSRKDPSQHHPFAHFENLMEEDILNLAVRKGSPLNEESLI